jgi:hypothetical protein
MTREQAKANLVACGVENPTEEQITSYLNQVNGAVKTERDRADKLKADADKVAELQKQLDEINSKGLSDVEKANKATEAALGKVAELEKSIRTMQTQKQLAELGITGESAEKFFDADGNIDFSVLGQILSDTKKNAATQREAELAGKAGNPNGNGNSGSNADEKTVAEQFAEKFAKQTADSNKATNEALASYLK